MKVLAVTSYRSDVGDMFWPKLGHLQPLTESKGWPTYSTEVYHLKIKYYYNQERNYML